MVCYTSARTASITRFLAYGRREMITHYALSRASWSAAAQLPHPPSQPAQPSSSGSTQLNCPPPSTAVVGSMLPFSCIVFRLTHNKFHEVRQHTSPLTSAGCRRRASSSRRPMVFNSHSDSRCKPAPLHCFDVKCTMDF